MELVQTFGLWNAPVAPETCDFVSVAIPEAKEQQVGKGLTKALGRSFDVAAERARLGGERVGMDDMIEALACLATAHRV